MEMNGKWNVVFTLLTGSVQGPHEKRLLHHLLDKYNTLERPVANESEPIQVSFGITLMQIIDVVSSALPCFNEILFHLSVKCNARYQRLSISEMATLWVDIQSQFKGCDLCLCREYSNLPLRLEPLNQCRRLAVFGARTLNSFNAIGPPLARNAPAFDWFISAQVSQFANRFSAQPLCGAICKEIVAVWTKRFQVV